MNGSTLACPFTISLPPRTCSWPIRVMHKPQKILAAWQLVSFYSPSCEMGWLGKWSIEALQGRIACKLAECAFCPPSLLAMNRLACVRTTSHMYLKANQSSTSEGKLSWTVPSLHHVSKRKWCLWKWEADLNSVACHSNNALDEDIVTEPGGLTSKGKIWVKNNYIPRLGVSAQQTCLKMMVSNMEGFILCMHTERKCVQLVASDRTVQSTDGISKYCCYK